VVKPAIRCNTGTVGDGRMSEDVVTVDRLIVKIGDVRRLQEAVGERDLLEIELAVENPVGSLDQVRWVPAFELRDSTGQTYPANEDDGLVGPIGPNETHSGVVSFEVAPDTMSFDLVFAPGSDDEAIVELVQE
jgi:hypothetical protein